MHGAFEDHRGLSLVSASVNDLRAQFPVLERLAYLNAGTNGPVPRRAHEAAATALTLQLENGRADGIFFEALMQNRDELRARAAGLLGCDGGEVALTGATTDGVNAVLNGLDLQPGDEVLTSDEEHPGLSAPLAVARERRGIEIRVVPFDELVSSVRPSTKLVACSHVSWMTGRVVDVPALAATDALVLLDGAQGLGAVPVDVRALGCDFYAASGQKWLCGPNGMGYLYVRAELATRLAAPWPGYPTVADNADPFEPELHGDARRFDIGFPPAEHAAWALASLDVLEGADLAAVQARAIELAAGLADELRRRGLGVAPRGDSTLVSFEADDPAATVGAPARRGDRHPQHPRQPVRAGVGRRLDERAGARPARLARRRLSERRRSAPAGATCRSSRGCRTRPRPLRPRARPCRRPRERRGRGVAAAAQVHRPRDADDRDAEDRRSPRCPRAPSSRRPARARPSRPKRSRTRRLGCRSDSGSALRAPDEQQRPHRPGSARRRRPGRPRPVPKMRVNA